MKEERHQTLIKAMVNSKKYWSANDVQLLLKVSKKTAQDCLRHIRNDKQLTTFSDNSYGRTITMITHVKPCVKLVTHDQLWNMALFGRGLHASN